MEKADNKQTFYPEIIKHGSLKQALRAEFEKIESELKEKIEGLDSAPKVKVKQKSAGIMASIKKRLFLCNFWNCGYYLATGDTKSLKDLAIAMHNWLILDFKISDLAKDFDFIKPSAQNEPFESGKHVQWNWEDHEKFIKKQLPDLIPVFQEAKRNQKLREHIIFTSHFSLGFSNCKIGHVCRDIFITPLSVDRFRVSLGGFNEILGDYTSEKAVRLVAEKIGNDCRACNEIK